MKILHTADWHLGKKIDGKSMSYNLRLSLGEIVAVCEQELPDAVIISGDVFDTAVPSSEAEEMFFEAVERLSHSSIVVAIAGNHDDAERLCAAGSIAAKHNIFLIGDLDNSAYDRDGVTAGEGWLKIATKSGMLNLALFPYPLESFIGGGEDDYSERVALAIAKCASCFSRDGANIFAGHFYCVRGDAEKMLGGARLLPKTVLPTGADYCALGHIHKATKVSSEPYACYSGSIIPCNFGETEDKFVNMISIDNTVTVRQIMLKNYKKLIQITATTFDEAYEKLLDCRDYAEILYSGTAPVTASDMGKLRSLEAFVKFTPVAFSGEEKRSAGRKIMTDEQLFSAFYEKKKGEKPDEGLVDLFMKAVRREELI